MTTFVEMEKGEPMSILIKGIDIPSRIDLDLHDNHIVLGGVLYPIDIDQLLYIPTPHGRLIDASELIKSYMKGSKTDIDDFYDTIDIIDNAPTILEAEE